VLCQPNLVLNKVCYVVNSIQITILSLGNISATVCVVNCGVIHSIVSGDVDYRKWSLAGDDAFAQAIEELNFIHHFQYILFAA
jgi:hypothetical protein